MIRTYCDDFKGLGEYDWSSHGQQIQSVLPNAFAIEYLLT